VTRRTFAVVAFVVVVLVAAAVGGTWYITTGGSHTKTEGRCERMPQPVPTIELANGRTADDEEALLAEGRLDYQARKATADQNPDECPADAHWETVSR